MKILLVSQVPPDFELKRKSNEIFPEFQAQAMWLRALRGLGHQVTVFLYSDPVLIPKKVNARFHQISSSFFPRIYNKYRLTKNHHYALFPENLVKSFKLSRLIAHCRPDKIIISGGISELVSLPFKTARKLGIPIYLLHGVNPSVGATRFETDVIGYFDWVITNDPSHAREWKKLGAKNARALPYAGIDPAIHHKVKLTPSEYRQLKADVVFVGTLFADKQQTLLHLTNQQFNFKIWGKIPSDTKLEPRLQPYYKGEAWGRETVKIYNAAKIVLNLVPDHMPIGGNMRTFEIPGSGAFQLANRCPRAWYEPDKEIVLFNSTDDLKKKVKYYLANPQKRRQIARAGFKRTHRDYTYKERFRVLLSELD